MPLHDENDLLRGTNNPEHVPPDEENNPDVCLVKTLPPPPVIPAVDEEVVPLVVVGEVVEAAEAAEAEGVEVEMMVTMIWTPRLQIKRVLPDVLNDAEMQQGLVQLLQDQRQTAAERRIAGIMITTTYKNGQRPTITRNSTSVRN